MKTRLMIAAGAALVALAACSRSNDNANQAGTAKGAAGLQVNAMNAVSQCMSPSDMNRPIESTTPDERRQMVSCLNAATARQLNTQLPRQIDPLTRLDRISTEGPLLTYHYTVLRPTAQLPAGLASQLETATRRMTCAQPQARQTLQFGGAYGFRWVDNQGTLIHEMRVDAC